MIRIPLFLLLAWRYVRSAYATKTVKTMVFMCSISIIMSSIAFALITAVMHGFEKATYKKLQSTYPDITIQAPQGSFIDAQGLITYLKKKYPDKAHAYAAHASQQMLIHPLTSTQPTNVVLVKGINPQTELAVSSLESTFCFAKEELEERLSKGIIIGNELAQDLTVAVGDQCTLLYRPDPQASLSNSTFSSVKVVVTGTFHTGISDYDASSVLCSVSFLENLLQQPCYTHVSLALNDPCDTSFYDTLQTLSDLIVYRWQDLYPSLIAAFNLEKYAMQMILFLISIITGINTIALLFMFITSKRIDIALLLSYGVTKKYIALIFLTFSLIIASASTLCGLCIAQLLIAFSTHYYPIPLPDVYYVTTLPLELSYYTMALLFLGIIASSSIAAVIPLKSIWKETITTTFRFE